jgi:hypothetical protein
VLINEGLASELAVARSYITTETARQLSEAEVDDTVSFVAETIHCRRMHYSEFRNSPTPASSRWWRSAIKR